MENSEAQAVVASNPGLIRDIEILRVIAIPGRKLFLQPRVHSHYIVPASRRERLRRSVDALEDRE